MGDFERDTAVTRDGAGSYTCDIRPDWWVVAGPNGGYLAAILIRALEEHLSGEPARPLRSLTVHYLCAPRQGPARIAVEIDRAGRSVSFVSVRLEQGERVCALARGVLALDREGFELAPGPPPEIAGPDDIDPLPRSDDAPPFGNQFDFRPAVGAPPFSGADEALTGGWIRLSDRGRELDAALLAALCDSWYPAVFATTHEPLAIPTLDLTVHLRAPVPRPDDWVLGLYRTRAARDGTLDEDATLWSRDGELLAHSRQLALAL